MGIESVNCSLVCFNSQKEQTKCSRNFRITAVALGILLVIAGIGIIVGVGSFGWALVFAGFVSFMIGTCCFYSKQERLHPISIHSPKVIVVEPRNKETNFSRPEAADSGTKLASKIIEGSDPVKVYDDHFNSLLSLKNKEMQESLAFEKQIKAWEQNLDDLSQRVRDLSKKITLENIEECKKEKADLQVGFTILENEPSIQQLKSVYNSAYKLRIENKLSMTSGCFKALNAKIKHVENKPKESFTKQYRKKK